MTDSSIPPQLPATIPPDSTLASPLPRPRVLLPERSDFLAGEEPAADKVEAFLSKALATIAANPDGTAHALVPWICDVLLSNHSIKAYGRDFLDFVQHMKAQGVDPLAVTADHVKLYKRALLEAGLQRTTIARRLSVLRGVYKQLAAKGLVSWETAADIAAIQAPTGIQKNSTPVLTEKQAVAFLEAIPTDTLQGIRDLALMAVYFITGCRASAIINTCVGHLETDGIEHYLNVTEKRHKKRRKILLDAARPVLAYVKRAGIQNDPEGPLFRPLTPNGLGLERRHLDRTMPWRLVKKYCRAAGINPDRLDGRGIGIHSLRKTILQHLIANGTPMHEVREFAGNVVDHITGVMESSPLWRAVGRFARRCRESSEGIQHNAPSTSALPSAQPGPGLAGTVARRYQKRANRGGFEREEPRDE